jgi:predicted amidohydrolase
MPVVPDKAVNLQTAQAGIKEARAQGAEIVVLPEMFVCPLAPKYYVQAAEPEGDIIWQTLSTAAREADCWLVGGSMPEKSGDKIFNTAYVFDPQGQMIAKHRKLHLFDLAIPGNEVRESDTISAGSDLTLFSTPWGKMGLCICFDVRFPEIFLLMAEAGAVAIFLPAVFSLPTGEAHWANLLRQRAVDHQLFVIGASAARGEKGFRSYAHSMIVNPWGEVLYAAGTSPTVSVTELDLAQIAKVRAELPLTASRRSDIYQVCLSSDTSAGK